MIKMVQLLSLFLSVSILWPAIGPQSRAGTAAAGAFHTVSYVEVLVPARAQEIAALKEYQTASFKQDGFLGFELFEQTGRPGHFAFIETWRDQQAFDARGSAVQKNLMAKLDRSRLSDLDRRPYRTLTTLPPSGSTSSQTVYVITHVDVSPNPQVPVLLQRMAEESRRDDGNIRFDVLQHTMRANHFTVIEAWRDGKAHDAHAAAIHTTRYREELGPMLGSPLDERLFERVQP
jgi:quinol monooxygenase YgiN